MTHLRLVAGTDVTGIPRGRPRAKQASSTGTTPNLRLMHAGPTLAAQSEAREIAPVTRRRRTDPLKPMKAEARVVLESLKLPGEDRTLGTILNAMMQHVRKRRLAGKSNWGPAFTKFYKKLEGYGILVTAPVYWTTPDEKLKCEVINENLLLQHFPECRPYEPVLKFFQF